MARSVRLAGSRPRSIAVTGAVVMAVMAALLTPSLPARAQQVTPCGQGGPGSYAAVSRPPQYGFQPTEIVSIDSNLDGVDIQMAIVRPDVPEGTKVPVIVEASVYYHPLQTLDVRACKARLTENFVPQGYAVALIAVRGSGDSGGCMNLFGPGERADLDQAITYLGEQPWSNGNVGMTGLSYNGSTPWEVASFGNPHLKTIVPASGVVDLFDLLFGGGVPDWRGPTTVINSIYYVESAAFYAPGRSNEHTVEVLACPEYAVGEEAALESSMTGELDALGYWADRRFRDKIEENYRGSVLLVQGLQDWNVNPGIQFPWINDFVDATRAEGNQIDIKYMLGQWGHSLPDGQRPDWADVLLNWFDYYLKGDTSVDLGAVAEVRDSSGRWRTASAWPPFGTPTTWSLTGDGRLASEGGAEGTKTAIFDPFHLQGGNQQITPPEQLRSQCGQATCLMFNTAAFTEEFRFAGQPKLRLSVTPRGPGGQLSAYLFARRPDGTVQRLGWGQVDLRFPNGVPRGEPQAQAVTPGQRMTVDFPLQPLDAVVPAGSQLQLVVSEGTAFNRTPTIPNYPVDVSVGGALSTLTVNAVQPAESDFFVPGE